MTLAQSMIHKRINFQLIPVNEDKFLAIGGTVEPCFAEIYDPHSDSWSLVEELGTFTNNFHVFFENE